MKPFKLIDRMSVDIASETMDEERQVMMEDGLRDVDEIESGDDQLDE